MEDGLFFSTKYMKDLVDTNLDFSKYKNTFYKLVCKNNKRSIEDVDNDMENDVETEPNSDNEYEYDKCAYDIYEYDIYDNDTRMYVDGDKSQLDDPQEVRMIKKRIIRKYIHYVIQKLTDKGIKVIIDY